MKRAGFCRGCDEPLELGDQAIRIGPMSRTGFIYLCWGCVDDVEKTFYMEYPNTYAPDE